MGLPVLPHHVRRVHPVLAAAGPAGQAAERAVAASAAGATKRTTTGPATEPTARDNSRTKR